jgi:hypothetical protein
MSGRESISILIYLGETREMAGEQWFKVLKRGIQGGEFTPDTYTYHLFLESHGSGFNFGLVI